MRIPSVVGINFEDGGFSYPSVSGYNCNTTHYYNLVIKMKDEQHIISYEDDNGHPFPEDRMGPLFYHIITEYQNLKP